MVGVIAAQSIGEKQTQSTLNTFHATGLSNQTVAGVQRVEEIINATSNQKFPSVKIHLNFEVKLSATRQYR